MDFLGPESRVFSNPRAIYHFLSRGITADTALRLERYFGTYW